MKVENYNYNKIIRAVLAMVIGVVMIVGKADVSVLLVQIIAAVFLASGLLSLFMGMQAASYGSVHMMGCNGPFSILIAILMFSFPEGTARLLLFFVGLTLTGLGLFRFSALRALGNMTPVGPMLFLMPILLVCIGVVLMFAPNLFGQAGGIVAGGALILYGVTELISLLRKKKQNPKDNIIDVEYTKVDEQ